MASNLDATHAAVSFGEAGTRLLEAWEASFEGFCGTKANTFRALNKIEQRNTNTHAQANKQTTKRKARTKQTIKKESKQACKQGNRAETSQARQQTDKQTRT